MLTWLLLFHPAALAAGERAAVTVGRARVAVTACGDTCRRATAQLRGGEAVAVRVAGSKGGTASFDIPRLPALAGSARGPGWRVPGGRKSLWGSVAFLATAFGLGALFGAAGGGVRPLSVTVAAAALTLVEAGAGFGLDNLLLPVLGTLAGRAWLEL